MTEPDLRAALARLVDAGPPPPSGLAAVAAGRRTRRRRTLTAVTAAAAAVLAVLAVAFTPGLGPVAAPPATTPTEQVDPAELPDQLPVPGLSPAQVRSLAYRCAMSAAVETGDPHPDEKQLVSRTRVYNYRHDQAGTRVLIYLPGGAISCFQESGRDVFGVYTDADSFVDWLPGPMTVETHNTATETIHGVPPNVEVDGRVTADVATVTLDSEAGSATVPAVNGTYSIRVFATSATIPDGGLFRVTARDRSGRVLDDSDGRASRCIRAAGHRLYSSHVRYGPTVCVDGVRWEPSRVWNPAGTVPLLPAADAARLTAGCAAAAGVPAAGLRLADTYDAVEIAGALLTRADGSFVACDYRKVTGPYAAVSRPTPAGRPAPVTIDYRDRRTVPVYQEAVRTVVAGRISAAVARVMVQFSGDGPFDAELHDGHFQLGAPDADGSDTVVVRAYDRKGRLLGTVG